MENSRLFTSFLTPQVLNAPGLFWCSSNLTFPDPLCKPCKLTWQPSFIVHAVHAATPQQGCPCRPSRMWQGILLVSDQGEAGLKSFPERGWQNSAPSALVEGQRAQWVKAKTVFCIHLLQKMYVEEWFSPWPVEHVGPAKDQCKRQVWERMATKPSWRSIQSLRKARGAQRLIIFWSSMVTWNPGKPHLGQRGRNQACPKLSRMMMRTKTCKRIWKRALRSCRSQWIHY